MRAFIVLLILTISTTGFCFAQCSSFPTFGKGMLMGEVSSTFSNRLNVGDASLIFGHGLNVGGISLAFGKEMKVGDVASTFEHSADWF